MKGAHRVIVETKKIKYDFIVKRNITIFTGDSGSGKTVLIDLIRENRRYGSDSGVFVSCDCACRTLDNEDWEHQLKDISKSIIFIDEGNRFLFSKKFAELVQESDNYFVLATREKLPMLPYSINEIYGIRKSGKFYDTKQKYNEIYHLYGEISDGDGMNPQFVITEDSNSGYEFFSELANQKGIKCISANGKSNIIKYLAEREKNTKKTLVVVDGAAFGSEMRDVYEYLKIFNGIVLYAPESFEWILLESGAIPHINVESVLQKPEDYIDSKKYVSWERFFTKLLIEGTQYDSVWSYSKKKLPAAYLSPKVLKAAKKVMKLITWDK
ncbi:MAG: hypothetical protein ACI4BB_10820 [Coprococcus sp.]